MLQRHTRLALPNSVHFVTTVTRERGRWFIDPELCRQILGVFERCRAETNIICLGYVLMPDHLHALVVQTAEGIQVPVLMRRFKRRTSVRCRPNLLLAPTLWRQVYDDVGVPGADACWTKLNYMHWNPVKKGLCEKPEGYPWSSAADYFFDAEKSIVKIQRELLSPMMP
jgi:REP element-mobilizing transposase RayT